jgi:hypothetical protein
MSDKDKIAKEADLTITTVNTETDEGVSKAAQKIIEERAAGNSVFVDKHGRDTTIITDRSGHGGRG